MEISNTANNQATSTKNEKVEEQKQVTEKQAEINSDPLKEVLQDDIVVLSGGHNGGSPKGNHG